MNCVCIDRRPFSRFHREVFLLSKSISFVTLQT
uniref:Uncharacterized protein n=1 Tax=Rhizophora mucronata TaxID=61149 RepID=A0A2P2J6U7_RHIMU